MLSNAIVNSITVKPVYNEQIAQNRSLKTSFCYNQSIFKEIYAIGENDVLSYNREFVITESVINGFNCILKSVSSNYWFANLFVKELVKYLFKQNNLTIRKIYIFY